MGEYKLDLNPNMKKNIFLLMSNFTIIPSVALMPKPKPKPSSYKK